MTELRAIILGCGSSGGVPRIGPDWGACDPANPRNRRTRSSLLVQYGQGEAPTSVLVDTSPDLREQFLANQIDRLDAIVYTHDHADQAHGIDDVRAVAYRMRKRIPTHMDQRTKTGLFNRFGYCFETPDGLVHPPILDAQPAFGGGDTLRVDGPGGGLDIDVIELSHGPTPSYGFIFAGKLAYTPDVHDISDTVLERISSCQTWIVDCLRYAEHPTHAHADKTLRWLARTGVPNAVFTNLHIDMDYDVLSQELPGWQILAHDGMTLSIS